VTVSQKRDPMPTGVVAHDRPEVWDELVGSLGGLPFQSWAWGELKSKFGWQPFRLSAEDGGSAAQLLIRPYRGLAVAYVPRGPLSALRGQPTAALIDAMVDISRRHRAAFLRFEPDTEADGPAAAHLASMLTGKGFKASQKTIQPRSSIRLDLAPPPEELFKGFSEGHRRAVRRAEKAGTEVRAGRSDADVEALHGMLSATTARKNFGIHSTAYYRALCAAFGDSARIFVATLDDEPVSALLALAWKHSGIYVAGGSTSKGLEARASHLLQWHALRWAREQGARYWDSWGIADARGRLELAKSAGLTLPSDEVARLEAEARRDPLDPLFQFKKGLGGEAVRVVPAYDRVFFKPAYWLWQMRRGEA
jgi:lipid II:glycine glycyltransferase (peptidoglycan interpeptide bridge formation enzyme)